MIFPNGIWGRAIAEIKYGAFWAKDITSDDNDFNYFSGAQTY